MSPNLRISTRPPRARCVATTLRIRLIAKKHRRRTNPPAVCRFAEQVLCVVGHAVSFSRSVPTQASLPQWLDPSSCRFQPQSANNSSEAFTPPPREQGEAYSETYVEAGFRREKSETDDICRRSVPANHVDRTVDGVYGIEGMGRAIRDK